MSFVIKTLKNKYDIHNPVEKKKVLHECFDLMRSVVDLSITQHYLSTISNLLEISDQIVLSQYKTRYKSNRSYQNSQTQETGTSSLDKALLLGALIINDNRKSYTTSDQLQIMMDYFKKLNDYSGRTLHNSFSNGESKENSERLNSELLWWDHELSGLDDNKIIQII